MKRYLYLCLALALSLASAVEAADSLSTTACPGAGCVEYRVDGAITVATVGIQASGTFDGALVIEGTIGGTTYSVLNVSPITGGATVSSITAPGGWTVSVAGLSKVRVRFQTYSSGTAVITRVLSQARLVPTADTLAGILPFSQGGFGFATATAGDLFYASATNTPGKLPGVGNILSILETPPTFISGFGEESGRTITGTVRAFSIVVGDNIIMEQGGTLGLPAAPNGWVCHAFVETNVFVTLVQIDSTSTSVTLFLWEDRLWMGSFFSPGDIAKGGCEPY